MTRTATIKVPVEQATAAALADKRQLEAIGRIVDRLVRPGVGDPLIALLEQTSREAQAAGLTDAEIDAEMVAYNSERRG